MFGSAINRLFIPFTPKAPKRPFSFRPTQSLPECFELANDEVYTRSHGFLHNRAYQFFSKDGGITRVSDYVNQRFGLTKFQYIGCGDNAVVVRYSEFQVLRFRAPAVEADVNTLYVLEMPFICPVWREFEFARGRLNFVPYVPSLAVSVSIGAVSRPVAEEYVFALLRVGFESEPPMWFYDYKNYDYKFEQIGLLSDGTPIIIDHGSIILETDAPDERLDRLAEDKRLLSLRLPSSTPQWDGSWVDDHGQRKIDALPRPNNRIMS